MLKLLQEKITYREIKIQNRLWLNISKHTENGLSKAKCDNILPTVSSLLHTTRAAVDVLPSGMVSV